MQRYSTADAVGRSKVGYWNETICETFADMEAKALYPGDFEASIDVAHLSNLHFSNPRSSPARVERTRAHVARTRQHKFFMHLQLENELTITQHGREAVLLPGDMVLSDSSEPYQLSYSKPCSTLVIDIPSKILKTHLPSPELIVGVKINGRRGLGETLGGMIRSIWSQLDEGFEDDISQCVARNLLDMMATTCSAANGTQARESSVTGSRRVQILRYIEANLRDPELSARRVAEAFRISTRYLHMLFAGEEETVSNYILRRRIEECAKQMSGFIWRGRTITEIAFAWGFNNTTHFARVFRNHYGMSPRDYRNQNVH